MPYEKAQALIERKLLGLQREARTQELIRRLQRQTRIESYVVGIRLDGELLRDSASESEAATGKSATADPGKKGEVSAAPGGESKS